MAVMSSNLVRSSGRYTVKSSAGASVTAEISSTSYARYHLPQDAIVVSAETARTDSGDVRVRICSPAGWLNASDLDPAEPASSLRLDFDTFQERHLKLSPGDHYRLAFPFTLDMIRAFGPEFLTVAFRAAGTISQENRVTEILELKPLAIMGASENAFLTVAYARPEVGLKQELFVKVPPANPVNKFRLSASSHGEVEILRLPQRQQLPVTVAKYYFGDFSSHTTNYILITERIGFGVPPIEPAYRKGYDHCIHDVAEHYSVLAKSLARLVGAHKIGALGQDIENTFPFARAARNFDAVAAPEVKIDRLIDFISRIAPQLFVTAGTKPAFLRQWRKDLLYGLEHKDRIVAYLHENADYTGLCHPNLNIDNAWFWRDEAAVLQVGLLDWGGVGQMSIAQAISGMLMMPEPEQYVRLVHEVIATFIAESSRSGGPNLDADELLFQYRASIFSTAIGIILSVVVDFLSRFSEEEYRTMKDRFDQRLQASGLCTAIVWIDNILRDWLEDVTPGDACRRIVARTLVSRRPAW